jgi:hypothetical protein
MELVYLASPYSHPDEKVRERRYDEVLRIMLLVMQKGFAVYCPIVQIHHVCKLRNPKEFQFSYFEQSDKLLLGRCDRLIICEMEGWQSSVGVTEEFRFAREIGLKIYYYNPLTGAISVCPTRANFQETLSETPSKSANLSDLN